MVPDNSIETIKRKAFSLEVINSFASALMEATTEHEIIWCIARHAIAKLGYDDCVIYTVDEGGKTIRQQAALGPDKNPTEDTISNAIVMKVGEGICGSVAATGVAEIISDTEKDPRYVIDDASRLSEIVVPIVDHNGEVLGIIDSEHPHKNFYSETDLEILSTVAKMAATRIGQARALVEIQRNKEMLQERVDQNTSDFMIMIDELRKSNEEIERRDHEKETLLKEIHHRVKNNLQIVSSILSLQAAKTGDESTTDIFTECQNQIKSMAIIHEQLYDQGDLARISTDEYVKGIAESLQDTYINKCEVKLECELERILLTIEKSVPFGLILNEILVNCFKHAFPENEGTIHIQLSNALNEVTLEIKDSGVGFNPARLNDSMGIGLVKTLTQQLEGSIEFRPDTNGTTVSLRFPV